MDELEQVLIAFRDNADKIQEECGVEGDVIPMSFIINNGDQDRRSSSTDLARAMAIPAIISR